MNRTAKSNRMIGLAVTSAMAAGLLSGCATQQAPRADLSASRAEAALAKGKAQTAVQHAEAAVQAEPQNAAYRAMLGSAYLDAGRFASAETTFNDAMKLGDNSARTALSLALALAGQAKYEQAAPCCTTGKARSLRPTSASPMRCPASPARASRSCRTPSAAATTPRRCVRTWPMPTRWPAAGRKRG